MRFRRAVLAAGISVLPHECSASRHLRGDLRIVGRQQKAIGRLDDVEEVTALDLHAREHFLGDDEACRGADGGEFKGGHSDLADAL